MAGIHLHPHDILDEGTTNIYKFLAKINDISVIFPQVNTIFERNPNPVGNLPHNPVHDYVLGNGNLYASIDLVTASPRLYQIKDETIIQRKDPLKQIVDANPDKRYKIIPWLNIFNGNFAGQIEENAIYDFRENIIPTWLCPNAPDVIEMWTEILRLLTDKYGFETYMIDRIRYPDWSGKVVNPKGLFTCFCNHCQQKMQNQGILAKQIQIELEKVAAALGNKNYNKAVQIFQQSSTIENWIAFRQQSITQFIKELKKRLHQKNPNIKFWIDLWPPSYAWILGQHYQQLTALSNTLKHFPYHKLGGGADVQGLISYFAKTKEEQEEAFQAFNQLFQFPYQLTYDKFKHAGFPIRFVTDENNKAREQSQEGTFIYSGIQMWNINNVDLLEAIEAGRVSSADDLIYYCYGWATKDHFQLVAKYGAVVDN